MALTGIQIFKLLPKTNCKECGVPTCLAFAMNLASGKAELDSCPYVSDEAREKLAEASAPPIRPVVVGAGVRKATTGGETVQYRHEKTFYNPILIGALVAMGLALVFGVLAIRRSGPSGAGRSRAVVGVMAGTELEPLASPLMAWEDFVATYPDGQVLDWTRTGHSRDYGERCPGLYGVGVYEFAEAHCRGGNALYADGHAAKDSKRDLATWARDKYCGRYPGSMFWSIKR